MRARPIYSGRSYKITRRCLGRLLLLSPGTAGEELVNFIGYCLAHAAELYGIQVHASVWMSNHHHTDVTDPDGNTMTFAFNFGDGTAPPPIDVDAAAIAARNAYREADNTRESGNKAASICWAISMAF